MLFHTAPFAAFALLVYPLYWLLPKRARTVFLLLASWAFYAFWDWRFLGLILVSTAVDYTAARAIEATPDRGRRCRWLALSIAANLGILGFFKYWDFFAGSAADLLRAFGFAAHAPLLHVVLPVGISFYTFQTLSYTIDVHRGRIRAERDPIVFALYVAFFPQLVAGPIERAERLLPQLARAPLPARADLRAGAWYFVYGLFQKVVVADNLGRLVDAAFEPGAAPAGATALLAIYAFAFQIYGDFAGYSNMARGLARFFGVLLIRNFDRPYLAADPREFWRRWHISLSSWLKDYLYIPLGGNRGGRARTYRNLLVTMVLGGLWHGAAWTFVLWGAFHGLWLALHRALRARFGPLPPAGRLGRWPARFVTFQLVCLGWLLFRAQGLTQAGDFLAAIAAGPIADGATAALLFQLAFFGGLLVSLEALGFDEDRPPLLAGLRVSAAGPAVVALIVCALAVLAPPGGRAFIYFQF